MRRSVLLVLAIVAVITVLALGAGPVAADAFAAPRPVVVLDPGHLAETVGAMSADGALAEHELTLELALKTAPRLRRAGYSVFLTRRSDGTLVLPALDRDDNGRLDDVEYMQPRTDLANLVRADVVVSLHFNGSADSGMSGSSVYYTSAGPYVTKSMILGLDLQRALVAAMRSAGYPVRDLGVLSDSGLKSYGALYSLGQNQAMPRKGRWPGVVIEPLFLTNAQDVQFLQRGDALDILAEAVVGGIRAFFEGPNRTCRRCY